MSLTVPCPCGTKLLAPDSAVGQRFRCPKCGELVTVPTLLPAEEVAVVEATVLPPPAPLPPLPPPPPPIKPKPILAEDASADRTHRVTQPPDDDEEEDRPRKKKRPRYADDDDYEHDRPRKKARRK